MAILNKYKRWKPQLIPIRDRELDFVLSQDNSETIDIDALMSTRCLISFIDMNKGTCILPNNAVKSLDDYYYENYINSGVTLSDIGLTSMDNGQIIYNKDTIEFDDFVNLLTSSTITLEDDDKHLYLNPINGNSKHYNYNMEIITEGEEENKETYYSFNGGFLQGYYKLDGFNYEVLPSTIENCWNMEFVIRPRSDYEENENTLNTEHPENKGIFFYIGTRAENKFARFYGSNIEKYEDRESYTGECFNTCTEEEKDITALTLCNISAITTTDGRIVEEGDSTEIETDNKYLIFDRTCNGYTTKTWDEENTMIISQKVRNPKENLFLLMNRTCSGLTTKDLDKYLEGQPKEPDFDILKDIKNNAFALKINEDNSVGYRYLIKDCDTEEGYKVAEEKTFANIINPDQWNVINVMFKILNGNTDKCGNSLGNRKMQIFIYVNGYLKLVSKELPEFRFRVLDDYYDKQEGVPFNISLGGGTQGLTESMWVDSYTHPFCKVLPLEKYFAGTFIGDIRSYKFYNCQQQYYEIKNNYMYELGVSPSECNAIKHGDITITFINDITKESTEVLIPYASKATKPEEPILEGYTFDNWYNEDGEIFDFDIKLKKSTTIIAKFNIIELNISFETKNGYLTVNSTNIINKEFTFVATGNNAAKFNHWEINGNSYTENPLTVTLNEAVDAHAIYDTEEEAGYKRMEEGDLLNVGDIIVFASTAVTASSFYTMSRTANTNNIVATNQGNAFNERGYLDVSDDTATLEVKQGKQSGKYSLYCEFFDKKNLKTVSGYLYIPSNSNYLRVQSELNEFCDFEQISYSGNTGICVIRSAKKDLNKRIITFNNSARIFSSYTSFGNGRLYVYKKISEIGEKKDIGKQEFFAKFNYGDIIDVNAYHNNNLPITAWLDEDTTKTARTITLTADELYKPLYDSTYQITFKNVQYDGEKDNDLDLRSINDANQFINDSNHNKQVQFFKEPFFKEENLDKEYDEIEAIQCFETKDYFNEITNIEIEYCVNKIHTRGIAMIIIDIISKNGTTEKTISKEVSGLYGNQLTMIDFNLSDISISGKIRVSVKMKNLSLFFKRLIIEGTN